VDSINADRQKAGINPAFSQGVGIDNGDYCRVEVLNRHFMGFGPACIFADVAISSPCKVRLYKAGRSVNAKSIMELLALCASPGDYLEIEAEGTGAEEAVRKLAELMTNSYGIR
jgi:phosphotransferase system HPr (HPr) family protein